MLKRVGGDEALDVFQPLVGGYKNSAEQNVGAISENGMMRTEIVQRHALNVMAQARADYETAHADYREAIRQHEKKEADAFADRMARAAEALNTHTSMLKWWTMGLVVATIALVIVGVLQVVAAGKQATSTPSAPSSSANTP
jgi:hypothetical protein